MLDNIRKSRKTVYLDHAAATPVHASVARVMAPYFSKLFGNPSSLYSLGRQAKEAIDEARRVISEIIGSKPDEIVFTAGGTESVNLAILGVARKHLAKETGRGKTKFAPHIITTAIEHHSVLESCAILSAEGVETTYLKVDRYGFVSAKDILAAIKPNTVLVSVMFANNEIGSIQPISEIGKVLHKTNELRAKKSLPQIVFHSDACQAAGSLEIDAQKLHVDLLSLNAGKIYGPKQVGLLYVRNGIALKPLVYGGGQEKNLRSGTENVAGIVGLAAALQRAQKLRVKENARMRRLRNAFIEAAERNIPGAVLNGPPIASDSEQRPQRLPNNVNFSVSGVDGEALSLYLDAYNVCASTGSACASVSNDPSHVIMALGQSPEAARGAMRFTFGGENTLADVAYTIKVMAGLVTELRRVSLAGSELKVKTTHYHG